jgi:hypothetical protein
MYDASYRLIPGRSGCDGANGMVGRCTTVHSPGYKFCLHSINHGFVLSDRFQPTLLNFNVKLACILEAALGTPRLSVIHHCEKIAVINQVEMLTALCSSNSRP